MSDNDVLGARHDLIKMPHVESFRRFFHIDSIEAAKKYKGFEDDGLKRILSKVLPQKCGLIDGGRYKIDLVDYTFCDRKMILSGKETPGLEIWLRICKKKYNSKGQLIQKEDESFPLCVVPKLIDKGYFSFVLQDSGKRILKTPIGQIIRAPGITSEIYPNKVIYIIKPSFGRKLGIVYGKFKNSRKEEFYLISLSKRKKIIFLNDFLNYIKKPHDPKNKVISDFIEYYIRPNNPLAYDLSQLGRININRISGGSSENTLLSINDILSLFAIILKTPLNNIPALDNHFSKEICSRFKKVISEYKLKQIGINNKYIDDAQNNKIAVSSVEEREKIKFVHSLVKIIQETSGKKQKTQIKRFIENNVFYKLMTQLKSSDVKASTIEPFLLDSYHLLNKKVNLIGDFLEKIFRLHFINILNYLPLVEHEFKGETTIALREYLKLESLQHRINKFINESNMIQYLNQCNPLSDISHRRKLTFFGENGTGEIRGAVGLRDIHYSMHSRICPFDTPQGPVTGLNFSLAMYADIDKFGQLRAPYKNKKTLKIEYHDASFDENNIISPIDPSEQVRNGKEELIQVKEKSCNYYDVSPSQMLSLGAALIPFLGYDDGPRAMMAISMMKQALSLKEADIPFIKTGHQEAIVRKSDWCLYAKSDGTVKEVSDKYIKINDAIERIACYLPTVQKTIFHHTPVVKEGDSVTEGQLIASGSGTVNGEIALGKNLLTAFMFYKGYNYEDAIVISESASKKLTSLHVIEIECDVMTDEKTINRNEKQIIDYLDDNGVIKVGAEVKPHTILVGKLKSLRKRVITDSLERLMNLIEKVLDVDADYINKSFIAPEGVYGKVIEVNRIPRVRKSTIKIEKEIYTNYTIVIKILSERPARVGDKLANRHGNKGVISKILPDDDMPHMEDGTPVEVILNPLGVFNRMNVGQLLEMHLSWNVMNSEKKNMIFPQFMEGNILPKLSDGFKSADLDESGKTMLRDGKEGNEFDNPIAVGYIYTMKLNHMSEDKVNVRSVDHYSLFLQQGFQGRKTFEDKTIHGGQRVGEMEVWALEAYNTPELLKEVLSIKSDDVTGRAILLRKLKENDKSSIDNYLPFTFKQALAILRGLCINIKPSTSAGEMDPLSLNLKVDDIKKMSESLMSHEDILNLSNGRIVSKDNLISENGLYREDIFGSAYDHRCRCGLRKTDSWDKQGLCSSCGTYVVKRKDYFNFRMGHIELPVIVPNPMYERYTTAVLGMNIRELVDKCIFDGKEPFDEINNIMKDIQNQISDCRKRIEQGGLSQSELSALTRRIKGLELLKEKKCLFIRYLPVIPVNCRFKIKIGNKDIEHPLNKSYLDIIRACNHYYRLRQHKAPKIILAKEYYKLYMAIEKHFSNLLDELKGKEGLIRRNLLGKRTDFSGRIVVVPDPTLKMDECGLPADFLGKLFKIEASRKLLMQGIINASKEYEGYLTKNIDSQDFHNLLKEVIKNRVILLNRFPTLHRMNIQAFHPILIEEKNVMKIPTTICASFNADFDGDQFSIHLPMSGVAQKEAKEKCLPSNNIVSPASGLLTPVGLNKDIIVGLYWLTMDVDKTKPEKEFEYLKDAMEYSKKQNRDYQEKISIKTADGEYIKTTVGRVIFNEVFDNDERSFVNENINQLKLDEVLYNYSERYGFSKLIPIIEKIKEIGFKCATNSGVGISYFDLPITSLTPQSQLDDLKKKYERKLLNTLAKNEQNNVSIIYQSGAGKKGSLIQICAFRGKMARPDGSEVPYPIMSNFRKGLSPLEYFVSGHGARKGAVDKAISTTKSGYLMRKIVEAVHQIRIGNHDLVCEGDKGIRKKTLIIDEKKNILLPLSKRIYLRYAAEDVVTKDSKVIVKKGHIINRDALSMIVEAGLESINIMSPVTCMYSNESMCHKCYGDLFSKETPQEGLAVGIIAAQSVSEPCTQLAMRVFHKGGVAERDITGDFGTLLALFEARNVTELESINVANEQLNPGIDKYEKLYLYMLNEIQKIFISEGITVDDRHIEVILREVIRNGEIRGIRKAAIQRDGFLAKISFENLKKMLVDTALAHTTDDLSGLKEKILISKSI